MPHETCSFCGQAAEGNHAIHRDGFDVGPEVPLCDECGGEEGPTCEEIWEKISTLVWVEQAAIVSILERHEGATIVNGRAPAWQFGLAAAFAHSTLLVQALQLEFASLFDSVSDNGDLQNALTGAVRMGAQGLEILTMITEWQGDEQTENHDQP